VNEVSWGTVRGKKILQSEKVFSHVDRPILLSKLFSRSAPFSIILQWAIYNENKIFFFFVLVVNVIGMHVHLVVSVLIIYSNNGVHRL
jgi:hypothetical protein